MKIIPAILFVLILTPPALADTTVYGGSPGSGVSTDTNCNQSQYYAIGKLCQQTGDGKLYKGTGSGVQEVGTGGGLSGKVCKTITNPAVSEAFLFDIGSARTVAKVWGIAVGGTSVGVTLQNAGADGSGSTAIHAALTVDTDGASTTTMTAGTLSNGDVIRLVIGAVVGAVTQVLVCYE